MARLDATTLAEYEAASTAATKAQAIIDALANAQSPQSVTVRIRSGASPDIMATGTMANPWATQSAGVITVGELTTALDVLKSGTPDADWTIEFSSGSRWMTGTFGLAGSGKEFTWSLATFDAAQTATLGTVEFTSVSNSAPQWSGAPSMLSRPAGATYDFAPHAADPDGDPLTFSLVPPFDSGYAITTAGVLTVGSTSDSLIVRVSDGVLFADTVCSVTVEAVTGGIRWHPNHGIKCVDDTGKTLSLTISDKTNQIANFISTSSLINFAFCGFRWGRVNPTGSTFSWTAVDSVLASLPAGKRAVLAFEYKAFAGGNYDYLCPSDLAAANLYVIPGSQSCIAVWRQSVMDRFISMIQAAAVKYNQDERVECVTFSESATGQFGSNAATLPTPAEDFSQSALATQLKRLYPAAKSAWPNTNVLAGLNSLSGQIGGVNGLLEAAYQADVGMFSPDAKPETANTIFTGVTAGEVPVRDYRGLMANLQIASSPALGEMGGPANIVAWAKTHGVTHLPWYTTHSTYPWSTVLAAIQADPNVLTTSCPVNYNGTCVA